METRRHRGTEKTLYDTDLTDIVIGCAIEVHRALGPGLLESAYEECLCYELAAHDVIFERQKNVPLQYKDVRLEVGYRLDLFIQNRLVVELNVCGENFTGTRSTIDDVSAFDKS